MCWCKYCKHYKNERCMNLDSANYYDNPSDYNSCKHSEIKGFITTEQYAKGFYDGYMDAVEDLSC